MEPQHANEFVKAASSNMLSFRKRKITILTMIIVIIAHVSLACANVSGDDITSNIDQTNDHETQSHLSHMRILHRQNRGYRGAEQKNTVINGTSIEGEDLAKAAELIESSRAGGPSGLVHLGSASDAVDRPIEVYDEQGKLMYVVGDSKDGTSAKVVYHEPKDCEVIGHYTLPGGKEPTIRSCGRNMCLYNVLAEQTGYDPNKLKDSVLNIMTKNIETFAKQMSDVTQLEMYSRMKLALGGAVFNARNPDETLVYLRNSDRRYGFQCSRDGHPSQHIPYKRSHISLLTSVSAELQKKINVYNDRRQLIGTIGQNFLGDPILLEYHKLEGDASGQYYSSFHGAEVYRLNDPPLNDGSPNFWGVLQKALKTMIINRMDAETIPGGTYCVELASMFSGPLGKSGYISAEEAAFVTYHAMQTNQVKQALAMLNQYKKNIRDSDDYVYANISLTTEDLNLPRQAYAAQWINGQMGEASPITSIFMKLQHYRDSQKNPAAPVHFQTNYPRIPPPPGYGK